MGFLGQCGTSSYTVSTSVVVLRSSGRVKYLRADRLSLKGFLPLLPPNLESC